MLWILCDGDADPTRALRSPDNLTWAGDGTIYVQDDKAEDESLTVAPLLGSGAVNPCSRIHNNHLVEGGQRLFLTGSPQKK